MYPLAMLMLFSAVVMALMVQVQLKTDLIQQHRAALDTMYVAQVTEAFQARLARTGSLGTMTLADIAGTDEGFKVRGVDQNRVFLASAGNVGDGTWFFDRLVIYAVSRDRQDLADPAVLGQAANNRCNTTHGLDSAAVWCGPEAGLAYSLVETRQIYSALLEEEAMRMETTLHKFARGYRGKFPRGALAIGAGANMCSLGGSVQGVASCNLSQCSGTRTIDKVPFDCADLFSVWGNATALNAVSNKHMVLASNAVNVRVTSAGGTRRIARELRVP